MKYPISDLGVFGDWFGECLEVYGGIVTFLRSEFGFAPTNDQIRHILKESISEGKPFKLITITHVDTSTSVLMDVESVSKIIHEVSPNSLIAVDGVCSIGAGN